MTYNCPKCHCGCLFEDHGRLVCLNCGAETAKTAAKNVRHVHHYQTYSRKNTGATERPKTVKQPPRQTFQPAPARQPAHRPSAPAQNGCLSQKKRRSGQSVGRSALLAVILLVFFLNVVVPLLTDLLDRPKPQPENDTSGILYWVAEGEVSNEEAEILDELVLDYNLEHDVPDMDEVHDYLTERAEEIPFGSWSVGDDGDGDVCLIVYP